MTKEQVKKYSEIEDEIQPLKNLMGLCGNKYRDKPLDRMWRMSMYVFCKKVLMFRCNEPFTRQYETILPKELQIEIVAVIENYIERREKEMEKL